MAASKEWLPIWLVVIGWIIGALSMNVADSYTTMSIMKLCREEGLKMDDCTRLAAFSDTQVIVIMFGVLMILSLEMGLGAYIASFGIAGLFICLIHGERSFRYEMHKILKIEKEKKITKSINN